jgi:hypothetical protein
VRYKTNSPLASLFENEVHVSILQQFCCPRKRLLLIPVVTFAGKYSPLWDTRESHGALHPLRGCRISRLAVLTETFDATSFAAIDVHRHVYMTQHPSTDHVPIAALAVYLRVSRWVGLFACIVWTYLDRRDYRKQRGLEAQLLTRRTLPPPVSKDVRQANPIIPPGRIPPLNSIRRWSLSKQCVFSVYNKSTIQHHQSPTGCFGNTNHL